MTFMEMIAMSYLECKDRGKKLLPFQEAMVKSVMKPKSRIIYHNNSKTKSTFKPRGADCDIYLDDFDFITENREEGNDAKEKDGNYRV